MHDWRLAWLACSALWTTAPLGGFAYLYSVEHAHHDCIFPLVEPCARARSDFVPVARLQSSSGSVASPAR